MDSFFLTDAKIRVGDNNQLMKLAKLIDWSGLKCHLKGFHKNEINSQGGQVGYDLLKMFKAILLGQWHNLSDPQLEQSLRVRLDFMLFTGFDVDEGLPDETTLCRFRNKLINLGLDKKLFKVINAQLENLGLSIQSSKGAVIDATIVESAARPRRVIELNEDRQEQPEDSSRSTDEEVVLQESVDPDAKWLKKGKECYFGFKGFISTSEGEGFIQEIHVTPANSYEGHELETLTSGLESTVYYADKAYAIQANADRLKERGIKNRILKKAARHKELSFWQKQFNKLASKRRYIVEQAFGTLKRRFGMQRTSYLGIAKVTGQFYMKATCFNLLKAINRLEIS